MKIKHIYQMTPRFLLLASLSAVPAVAQPVPNVLPASPVPPDAVDTAPAQTIQGTVDGFNRDPRGRLNSVVVKTTDGKLDQFNLPPDLGDMAMHIASDGQKVTAIAIRPNGRLVIGLFSVCPSSPVPTENRR